MRWSRRWAGWVRSGESPVSMALTSTPHRRRTPWRNRRIPTIFGGRFNGGLVDVSTVDTGLPAGATSRCRGGEAGHLHLGDQPHLPPARPPPTPALWGPGGVGETPALAACALGRPTPRGWGSTVQGLCVLHEGPTHLEYPRPSSSSAPPSCSTGQALSRRPRVVAPAPAGEASNENQAGFVRRTGVLGRRAPRARADGPALARRAGVLR